LLFEQVEGGQEAGHAAGLGAGFDQATAQRLGRLADAADVVLMAKPAAWGGAGDLLETQLAAQRFGKGGRGRRGPRERRAEQARRSAPEQ
jgi:hypothetical protein